MNMDGNKWEQPAVWAAPFGWINLILFSWVMALRLVVVDMLVGLIWTLFFLFALGATAMGQGGKEEGEQRGRGERE